ncbi:MAG: hypothetical protein AB4206_19995 [Xenococcaceae cyanobacterium]
MLFAVNTLVTLASPRAFDISFKSSGVLPTGNIANKVVSFADLDVLGMPCNAPPSISQPFSLGFVL